VSKVLVVDTEKRPLNPVHPGRARILLSSGQAAVYRRYPFTIVLKKIIEKPAVETLRVKQVKRFNGFQTGDIVRAIVRRGKKIGTYVGRVAKRATGYFNITMKQGTVQGISYRSCTHLHHCDGYSYQKGEAAFSPNPVNGMGLHAALE
jgi:hypothetical protein